MVTKRQCAQCGKTFNTSRSWQAFCNAQCRSDYNNGIVTKLRRAWREHQRQQQAKRGGRQQMDAT